MFFNRPYKPQRLCTDCFWYVPRGVNALCTHPKNTTIILDTGRPSYGDTPQGLRHGNWVEEGDCGERGKWWEPKIDG